MVPSVDVREATAGDAAALAGIAAAAYAVYLPRMPDGMRPVPMDANYAAVVERGGVWVTERDGTITGFVVIVVSTDHVLLENIAVHPDFQGQGVGRRLLALVEDITRRQRLTTIRLYTHVVMVENQRLYERLGYVETERRRDDDRDRVFYEKALP
ncbi:GNAT family N-acetyltransferase [Herbiconiux sp. CPCC 205763]|uniref:GNAT family N-acetyltransferase n=1 Tax=Herbiconiux aconitum TaxID=2970913 RepID=A0ABT2GRM7_9MICO|nr:GNAT family N-acetyltransferase [Herbiconiux aconitum]MCS5717945.1 GNAT family N-acetyltransferase [Herbiconiux aconitum]